MFENDVKKVIDRYDNNMFKNLKILLKYNYDNRNETTLDRIDLNNTFVQNNFTRTKFNCKFSSIKIFLLFL